MQKSPTKCSAEGLGVIAGAKNQIHTGDSTSPDYIYDAAGNMTSDITTEPATSSRQSLLSNGRRVPPFAKDAKSGAPILPVVS